MLESNNIYVMLCYVMLILRGIALYSVCLEQKSWYGTQNILRGGGIYFND